MSYDIINSNGAAEKLAARLSGKNQDMEAALQAVRRSDFADDETYLAAATKTYLERNTPEYQKAYAAIQAEYTEQQEAARRKRDSERYANIKASVKLDEMEMAEVEKNAREAAGRDLAAGRISYGGMGAAIQKYADKLTAEAKESKAGRIMLNETIRASWHGER